MTDDAVRHVDTDEFWKLLYEGCRNKSKQVALKYLEMYAKMKGIDQNIEKEIKLSFDPTETSIGSWNETVKDLRTQDFENMTDLFEMIPDKKYILDEFIAEQQIYEDMQSVDDNIIE